MSSPAKLRTREEEEEALRQRVRHLRLQRLAEEQLQNKVSLSREGAQIRAEVSRLRQQIMLTSSLGNASTPLGVGGVSGSSLESSKGPGQSPHSSSTNPG